MVLSNKKLKQKLRAEIAEFVTTISNSNNSDSNPTNPEIPKSLKQLLDSNIHKPILTKREKRRETLNSRIPEAGNGKVAEKEVACVEETEKSKKKKRKREKKVSGEPKNGGVNGEIGDQNGVAHVEETEKCKKKKRKREKTVNGEPFNGGVDGELGNQNEAAHVEETEKSKKKKRKREKIVNGDQKNGGVDGELGVKEDGGDLSKEGKNEKTKKKNENEKKKKKKKKKRRKNGKKEGQSEVENGEVTEQSVPLNVDYSNSLGNIEDNKKVYVGGIPYYSTEDDIRSYFDHCGTITDVDCMTFPESGKFRGIAFVSFKTEEAAKRALALDGSDMGGLYLILKPYKATHTAKTTTTTDFSPPVLAGYNRIYAGNLSWDITEDDLQNLFAGCNISAVRFGEDKETGEFKGYAHVDFADNASLTKALKLDQTVVCERPVRVRCAVPPKKGGVIDSGSGSTVIKGGVTNSGSGSTVIKGGVTNSVSESTVMKAETMSKEAETQNNGGVSAGKIRRRTCYECGERGHISSACPKKQASEETNPSAT